MKKVEFCVAALLIFVTASAQKLSGNDVPQAVKVAFTKIFPTAKKVTWEKERAVFEAGFTHENKEKSATFDKEGKLLETEVEIDLTALPANSKAYIARHYPAEKIKECSKITTAAAKVTYEAEIKGKELIFNDQGDFVKEIGKSIAENED